MYTARWGHDGHSNEDIFGVVENPSKFDAVVAANPEVLVGGFPCQDYSVAKPANQAAGLEGRQGVLWWAVHRALENLRAAAQPVKYLVLENVDRLLASPTACRGRDFAIIVASLNSLGYAVEWRVVNAADYGFPQRRRRVFLVGYHNTTDLYQRALARCARAEAATWMCQDGVLARALPAAMHPNATVFELDVAPDAFEMQQAYTAGADGKSRFRNAGIVVDGRVWTFDVDVLDSLDVTPYVGSARRQTLGDVVARTQHVAESFYLDDDALANWRYAKGAKTANRVTATGYEYTYREGALPFPDPLDRPARTIITAEGGSAASRTKHVVCDRDGRLRRLTPEEVEELLGFPRGFTRVEGVSDTKRCFLVGNALVVGLVRAIGAALACAAAGAL